MDSAVQRFAARLNHFSAERTKASASGDYGLSGSPRFENVTKVEETASLGNAADFFRVAFCPGPFRDLLLLTQAQTTPFKRFEHIMTGGRISDGQRRGGLFEEPVAENRTLGPSRIPPCDDVRARLGENGGGGNSLFLELLIDPGSGRQQVPQIAARPCRPRNTVVYVVSHGVEGGAGPDACQGTVRLEQAIRDAPGE